MTDPDASRPPALQPLNGSERRPVAGSVAAPVPLRADERVEATLVLRRRRTLEGAGTMTREAFASRFGADPEDVARARTVLAAHDLDVLEVHEPSRRMRIAGSVAALERAFGTSLTLVAAPGGEQPPFRQRSGALSVPAELDGIVTAVLGLDDRPQSRTRYRRAAASTASGYTPPELATAYDFPVGTDGTGQTIAIVELGGGFAQSELTTYFTGLGLPTPEVVAVPVDGGENVPGKDPDGADGEVLLDIEVVGALASGSRIAVYFAPNTDAGFLDAVAEATHAAPTPVAISISWGQSEDQWTAQARTALDEAMADAAALGVTVTVAAGDDGSSDGATDGQPHADFPASSPHALACGGTSLHARGGVVQTETVWNDGTGGGATGGGVSRVFGTPAWQQGSHVPASSATTGGRGVPDVAADADPETGYRVLVDGRRLVIGGTSAVAPLWAALVARLAQALGAPLGLVQPSLYAAPAGFRDITVGTNGSYSAAPGWDPCTGLGVPQGTALLAALRARGAAQPTDV